MAKKKTNPKKIPIAADSFDPKQIIFDATNRMVLRGWGLVLGALADFKGTTTESLLRLWDAVNAYSSSIHDYDDVEDELKRIEKIADISIPFERVFFSHIKTQGDLDRFIRKTYQNALYSAFAIMANPIIEEKLLCEDDIAHVFRKAYDLEEEINEGRIAFEDIQDMLKEEYDLQLYADEHGQAVLHVRSDFDGVPLDRSTTYQT